MNFTTSKHIGQTNERIISFFGIILINSEIAKYPFWASIGWGRSDKI